MVRRAKHGARVAVVAAAAAALGAAAVWLLFFAPERRPHVLFISVDTLRADYVGCLGAARDATPAIDRLAAAGYCFAAAYAPRGETGPSLATVLTGRNPTHHGVYENWHRLAHDVATLPALLGRAGYETAAIVANPVVEACRLGRDFQRFRCTAVAGEPQWRWDAAAVEEACVFLAGREAQAAPFFLWVHLMDPHSPWQPAPEDRGRFARHTLGLDGSRAQVEDAMFGDERFDAEDLEEIRAMYAEEAAGSDRRVGRLLDALRAAGLEDSTIVVFFSDHGEELGDHHGYFFHSASVYRQVLHVPLIVRVPGARPDASRRMRTDVPVSLADIAPTVAGLAGISFPSDADGVDLRVLMAEGRLERDAVFTEFKQEIIGVITASHHYIHNPGLYTPVAVPSVRGGEAPSVWARRELKCTVAARELYDLRADPLQQRDIAREREALCHELAARAEAYAAGRTPRAPEAVASAKDVSALEEMGYVGRGAAARGAQEAPAREE